MAAVSHLMRIFKDKGDSACKHRDLTVLMISATFTGTIIQKFEEVLQSVVVLTSLSHDHGYGRKCRCTISHPYYQGLALDKSI